MGVEMDKSAHGHIIGYNTDLSMSTIIGIDEAGRGPLAGPVAVGAVKVSENFDRSFFKGIRDSKKLSEAERELWYALALEAKKRGELDFAVVLVSEKIIDKHGISYAIKRGIKRVLKKVSGEGNGEQIFLDGGLKAPEEFIHQLTIIRGDEKIPAISLASIMAKVTRDRLMVRISKKYPEFAFEMHKGYGTAIHRQAIIKYGSTEIHRKSFLKGLQKVV
jgi:ribonuclease HII